MILDGVTSKSLVFLGKKVLRFEDIDDLRALVSQVIKSIEEDAGNMGINSVQKWIFPDFRKKLEQVGSDHSLIMLSQWELEKCPLEVLKVISDFLKVRWRKRSHNHGKLRRAQAWSISKNNSDEIRLPKKQTNKKQWGVHRSWHCFSPNPLTVDCKLLLIGNERYYFAQQQKPTSNKNPLATKKQPTTKPN